MTLPDETVLAIYHSKEPGFVLAARHRVLPSTVTGIRKGRRYPSVTGGAPQTGCEKHTHTKPGPIPPETVLAIFHSPLPNQETAAAYGVSPCAVSNIWNGKTYRDVTAGAVKADRVRRNGNAGRVCRTASPAKAALIECVTVGVIPTALTGRRR